MSPVRYRVMSGGGGGGSGDVAIGPSFGQSAGDDPSTFDLGVNLDTASVDLAHTKTVGVNHDFESLALANTKTVGLDQTQDLGYTNTKSVGVNHDIISLDLENTKSIGVNHDIDNLALASSFDPGVHLSGTVDSAPFWQSFGSNNVSGGGAALDLTIPKPSGTVQGELMVAYLAFMVTVGFTSVTAPTGWTLILQHSNPAANNPGMGAYWKIAGASEPADYTWTCNATTNDRGYGSIHRITGAHATTPINASAGSDGGQVDPPVAGVTTTVANCLVISALAQNNLANQTYTPPAGWTEVYDEGPALLDATAARKVFAATGATGTQTFNSNGTLGASWDGITVAIAPGTLTIAS